MLCHLTLSYLTCLGVVRVWRPVALATMVWLLPGLGCSDRVKPEMAWTLISVMDTLSSVTENGDSPNTASTASGDSTCRDAGEGEKEEEALLLSLHMTEGHRLSPERTTDLLSVWSSWNPWQANFGLKCFVLFFFFFFHCVLNPCVNACRPNIEKTNKQRSPSQDGGHQQPDKVESKAASCHTLSKWHLAKTLACDCVSLHGKPKPFKAGVTSLSNNGVSFFFFSFFWTGLCTQCLDHF